MPRDGNGQFVRNTGVFTGSQAWQQTRDADRAIRADDGDTHDQDVAQALTDSLARNGEGGMTGPLNMGTNRIINAGASQSPSDIANTQQNQESFGHLCSVTGGGGNNIVLSCEIAPTAYRVGQKFIFVASAPNTGMVTVNVNGLGAVAVKKRDGQDLEMGDILAAEIVILYHTGSEFLLTSLANFLPTYAETALLSYVDDGAAPGPTLELRRESTSPAVDDFTPAINLSGRNSAAGLVNYGRITTKITSPTAGSTNSQMALSTQQGGVETAALIIDKGVRLGLPTGGDKGTGTLNALGVYVNGEKVNTTEVGATATTTGATVLITGLDNARRIEIILRGVSGTGNDNLEVTIGHSGGIETTGYVGSCEIAGSGFQNPSDAFLISTVGSPPAARSGRVVLARANKALFAWVCTAQVAIDNTGVGINQICAQKALSADLDRIQLQWSGPAIFDGGEINIFWEAGSPQ